MNNISKLESLFVKSKILPKSLEKSGFDNIFQECKYLHVYIYGMENLTVV